MSTRFDRLIAVLERIAVALEHTRRQTLGDGYRMCPSCSGLGAQTDGQPCGQCYGEGRVCSKCSTPGHSWKGCNVVGAVVGAVQS